jgi:hypothetical protein
MQRLPRGNCRLLAAAVVAGLAAAPTAWAKDGKSTSGPRQSPRSTFAPNFKLQQTPKLSVPNGTGQFKFGKTPNVLKSGPFPNVSGNAATPRFPAGGFKIDPSIFKDRVRLPENLGAGGIGGGAGGNGGPAGVPRPGFRIPQPGQAIDPSDLTGRIPLPGQIDWPDLGNADPNQPGDNPPADNPPADNPPADNPPADNPPQDPPADNPPQDPPADNPPAIVPIPWPLWPIGPGGGNYCPTPVYPAYPAPAVEQAPQLVGTVDLVLEDVQYVEPATALVGPAYRIKFRNQGLATAGAFRVALLAGMDGRIAADPPQATVDVPGLESGQAHVVTVRLPRTAMRLVATSGQPSAFTHLFVAVDADRAVGETDEVNNLAVLERIALEEAAR